MKTCQLFSVRKIWKRILLFPLHIELTLKTLLCNWRGSTWRPGRMKSIIQKGIIPGRTQSQDKKFQTSRPCEVRRSGQVATFVVCAVLSLSFQAVVLLTKTAINHRFFSIKSKVSDGFEKFQWFWVKELLLYKRIEAFFENFHQKWKMHHVELNSGTSKSSK